MVDNVQEIRSLEPLKLLYLIKRPLKKRDLDRFGINFMRGQGHGVTVLDMSEAVHPEIANERCEETENCGITVRAIKNWREFDLEQSAFAESDLVFFLIQSYGLSRTTYRPLRMLARTKTPYLIMAPVYFPGSSERTAMSQQVKSTFSRLRLMDPLNSIIARLPRRWMRLPAARYKVLNGLKSCHPNDLDGPETQEILTHTHDYDICMSKTTAGGRPKNQAVFLDQYMPYHPDAAAIGIAGKLDPEPYYRLLRRLFDRIENELGLKVVIAAHPRSDYENHPGVFGNRDIFQEKTFELIAESKLVLTHTSTAVSMAIVMHKPVMILATQDILKYNFYFKPWLESISETLGTPLRFFDDPAETDLSGALEINEDAYGQCVADYMKHPKSVQKPLWQIVHESITATSTPAIIRQHHADIEAGHRAAK